MKDARCDRGSVNKETSFARSQSSTTVCASSDQQPEEKRGAC